MKRTFTEEDILRFIFNEMGSQESSQFLDALCQDEKLFNKFESYQQISDKLVPIQLSPSEESVKNILDYVSDTQKVDRYKISGKYNIPSFNTVLLSGLILLATGTILGSVFHGKFSDVNASSSISQQQEEVLLKWEEDDLNSELDAIKEEIENLKEEKESEES